MRRSWLQSRRRCFSTLRWSCLEELSLQDVTSHHLLNHSTWQYLHLVFLWDFVGFLTSNTCSNVFPRVLLKFHSCCAWSKPKCFESHTCREANVHTNTWIYCLSMYMIIHVKYIMLIFLLVCVFLYFFNKNIMKHNETHFSVSRIWPSARSRTLLHDVSRFMALKTSKDGRLGESWAFSCFLVFCSCFLSFFDYCFVVFNCFCVLFFILFMLFVLRCFHPTFFFVFCFVCGQDVEFWALCTAWVLGFKCFARCNICAVPYKAKGVKNLRKSKKDDKVSYKNDQVPSPKAVLLKFRLGHPRAIICIARKTSFIKLTKV